MMTEAILLADVKTSLRSKQLYGKKGDRVQVIADHNGVMIVEGPKRIAEEKGKDFVVVGRHRYPVLKSKLKI